MHIGQILFESFKSFVWQHSKVRCCAPFDREITFLGSSLEISELMDPVMCCENEARLIKMPMSVVVL